MRFWEDLTQASVEPSTQSPLSQGSCAIAPGSHLVLSSPALLSHWLEAAHVNCGLSVNTAVDSTTAAEATVRYAPIAGLSVTFSWQPPMLFDPLDFPV